MSKRLYDEERVQYLITMVEGYKAICSKLSEGVDMFKDDERAIALLRRL